MIFIKRFSHIVFFVASFLTIFSLTCSAGVDDNYTLKELLTANGASFYVQRFGKGGSYIPTNAYFSNDNYLNATAVSGTPQDQTIAFGLQAGNFIAGEEDRTPIFLTSANDQVVFSAQSISYTYKLPDSSNVINDFTLLIRLYFTDGKYPPGSSYANSYPVEVLKRTNAVFYQGTQYCNATFNNVQFDVSVPQKYIGIWKMEFEIFTSNATAPYSTVSLSSSNIDLYIGDRAGAPLYPGADAFNQDRLDVEEDNFRNDADKAHNQFNGLFGSFKELFAPNSDFLLGLTWVTAFLNRFISGIPGLNSLLIFSITFGLLLFIIGSVGFVVGKVKSNQAARVRAERRSRFKRRSG